MVGGLAGVTRAGLKLLGQNATSLDMTTCPAEFLGNILSDMGSRRGIIERQESIGGDLFEVEAHVPLAKLFDYADKVRSLSQGRAASAMEPYSYEPAPDDVVKQLLGE